MKRPRGPQDGADHGGREGRYRGLTGAIEAAPYCAGVAGESCGGQARRSKRRPSRGFFRVSRTRASAIPAANSNPWRCNRQRGHKRNVLQEAERGHATEGKLSVAHGTSVRVDTPYVDAYRLHLLLKVRKNGRAAH